MLVDDVIFDIHSGEVLGIAGVEGNGQAELVEAIMGIAPPAPAPIVLGRAATSPRGRTRRRREAGIGYIPEDRHRHGLLLEAPLWENRILGHQTEQPNVTRSAASTRSGPRRDTRRIVERVRRAHAGHRRRRRVAVRRQPAEADRRPRDERRPELLIASHPTRGVDVGAQAAIWEHLRDARADGLAVLLISADLDELIGLSDTLQVILRGRLVADVDPRTVTPEELGAAMTGARDEAAHMRDRLNRRRAESGRAACRRCWRSQVPSRR